MWWLASVWGPPLMTPKPDGESGMFVLFSKDAMKTAKSAQRAAAKDAKDFFSLIECSAQIVWLGLVWTWLRKLANPAPQTVCSVAWLTKLSSAPNACQDFIYTDSKALHPVNEILLTGPQFQRGSHTMAIAQSQYLDRWTAPLILQYTKTM